MSFLYKRHFVILIGLMTVLGTVVNAARPRVLPAPDRITTGAGREISVYRSRLHSLTIGVPHSYGGLTVFPLSGRSGNPDYYLLDEAIDKHYLVVEDTGSVNEVKVKNQGTRPVLVIDGEEIVGAKQNRIFNSSFLVPPKRTISAKVSCVEENRWTSDTAIFKKSGTQLFARARQSNSSAVAKNMASSAAPMSDQSQIWGQVAEKNRSLGVQAETKAMHRAYQEKGADLDVYVKQFVPIAGQVGAVFAVNGEIVGFDVFDSEKTLARMYPKLIKSYALDALPWKSKKASEDLTRRQAQALVDSATAASGSVYPSQGLGSDLRVRAKGLTGAALISGGEALHIAVFTEQQYTIQPSGGVERYDHLRIR
ncbi:MAG: DUF6569 family protein [Armatimonadota bacterium]